MWELDRSVLVAAEGFLGTCERMEQNRLYAEGQQPHSRGDGDTEMGALQLLPATVTHRVPPWQTARFI